MPHRSARRWLWLAFLATLPVPFFLGQLEWAPVLRLAFLDGLFVAVALVEGGYDLGRLAGVGFVQALAYAGVFWLVADVGARAVARIGSPPLRTAALGTALFLLFATALLPIYETPLSSARSRSNLWQIFE